MTMEVIGGVLFVAIMIFVCVFLCYLWIALDRAYNKEQARLQKELDRIRNGDKEEKNE